MIYPDHSPKILHQNAYELVTLCLPPESITNLAGKKEWQHMYSTGVIKTVVMSNYIFNEVLTFEASVAL